MAKNSENKRESKLPENPNNCAMCDYKKMHTDEAVGWCYMFRDEPDDVCMQHTARKNNDKALFRLLAQLIK
jgi:hypothetical protein